MKILITGSAGFLGAHLVDHLLINTEHLIVGLDRLDFSGNLNRLSELESVQEVKCLRFRQIHHDLRAEINPFLAAQIGPVDWVLHLAAASHVDRSIVDPLSFVYDNMVGTCNILNFARSAGAKTYYQSTDEVFGPTKNNEVFKEWDRYKSGSPYSASKAGAEELCLAFQNTYGMHIVIGHTMNVLGIRQHPEKYLPSTIRKIMAGETVLVHADPTCQIPGTRYYINASDVARGICFLILYGQSGDKYNLVGERQVSNLELAEQVASTLEMPLKHKLVNFHQSRPGHDLAYGLCGKKMELMGFRRLRFFEDTIEEIVEWTKTHPHWLNV